MKSGPGLLGRFWVEMLDFRSTGCHCLNCTILLPASLALFRSFHGCF
jgi:hypothetical protein